MYTLLSLIPQTKTAYILMPIKVKKYLQSSSLCSFHGRSMRALERLQQCLKLVSQIEI